jgi:RHS repeat-associated protein
MFEVLILTPNLATLTQGNRVASYTYEGTLGVIAQVKIETDGTERYRLNREHDRLGRVTRIDTHGNETTLHTRRDYTHNAANQRTVVREEDEQAWHFDYDSLGQVIKAKKTVSGSEEAIPGYAFEFSFDNIGNRTNATSNGRTADYTSDALNRYTQRDFPGAVDVRGHAPEKVGVIVNGERTARTDGDFYAEATADNSAASVEMDITVKAVDPGPPELLAQENRSVVLPETPEAFTHDLDGNLIQDGLWTYEWDAENRLIGMESRTDLPASVTRQRLEFAYDGRSRRIAKTVKEYDLSSSAWTTTKQVNFLYDNWNLIAEFDVLNSQALLRSHAWGLDLSGTPQGAGGVGGLLWTTQATNTYAPGFDANGNIIAWIDLSDGTLAGTSEYGAFGETLVKSGLSADLPFGFSTKYEDAETGLLYYGYRIYAPSLGRWLNRDILGEWAAFQSMNQEVFAPSDYYLALPLVFVSNDPIGQVDLAGLKGVPTVPGRPPSTPMRPPSATGVGGAIGYGLESIFDGVAFGGQLGRARALASLGAVLGAFDSLCNSAFAAAPAEDQLPSGCGCCVMAIWLAWQYDATRYSPPSGAIIGVRKADLVYVPQKCDDAPSGDVLFGSHMWPGNNTTVQYKRELK